MKPKSKDTTFNTFRPQSWGDIWILIESQKTLQKNMQ